MKKLLTGIILLTLIYSSAFATALQIDALWSGINNPSNGKSYAGAIVATFASGTTTPKAVWENKEKTLPSALGKAQFTLDSNGQAFVYGDGVYKINIYAPTDTGLTSPLITIDGATYTVPGSTVTGISLNDVYDCDLADAVSDIGAVTQTTLTVDCDCIIDDGTAVVSTENISINVPNGGSIDGVAGGGTENLTIQGPFIAGIYQVFGDNINVSGTPKISNTYSEWWGSIGNDSIVDTVPFQRAITSFPGIPMKLVNSIYIIDGYLQGFTPGGGIIGPGTLKMADGYWGRLIYGASTSGLVFRDFDIDGNRDSYTSSDAAPGYDKSEVSGILLQDSSDCIIENIKVTDWPTNIALGSRSSTGGTNNKIINCSVKDSGKVWDPSYPYLWHVTAIDVGTSNSQVANCTVVNFNDTGITLGEDGPNGVTCIGNVVEIDSSYGTNYKAPTDLGTGHGIAIGGNMALYDTSHHVVASNTIRSTHPTEKLIDGIFLGAPNDTSGITSTGVYSIGSNTIFGAINAIALEATFFDAVFNGMIVNSCDTGIAFNYGSEYFGHLFDGIKMRAVTNPVVIGESGSDESYTTLPDFGVKARLRGVDTGLDVDDRQVYNIITEGSYNTVSTWTLGTNWSNPASTDFGGSNILRNSGTGGGLYIASQVIGGRIRDGWHCFTAFVNVTNVTNGDFWFDINDGAGQNQLLFQFGESVNPRYGWSEFNNKGWVRVCVWANIAGNSATSALRIIANNITNGGTVDVKFSQLNEGVNNTLLYSQTVQ